jgi:predicted acyl esterase
MNVPAFVVASYSNTLHTAGTFRAWRRLASADKWLRIHNSQEWPDYYDEANVEDLRRFFDRYLKDIDNDWEATPHVRYSVHDFQGGDQVNVPADAFPPKEAVSTKLYLDGAARILNPAAPASEVPAMYDVGVNPDVVSFITRFDKETVMVGYPKANLWVVARGADDMDLFVLIQKLDRFGSPLQQFTAHNQSARIHDLTDHGATVLRYKGSDGRLRVSTRHLDDNLSTDDVPAHSFDRIEKLAPGEVVNIEIDLLPIGMAFHPGEQLRFIISSRNLSGTLMPGIAEYVGANSGQHVIHTGGKYASYLQLPILAD